MDFAIGWQEWISAVAAISIRNSELNPVVGHNLTTSKTPWVNVPVLSKTTVFTWVKASRKLAPLTRIPCREAPPTPPKYPKGTEITKAQGHEITRIVKARYSQTLNTPPPRRGGTSAIPKATNT